VVRYLIVCDIKGEDAGMMSRIYAVLVLMMVISISAYAQSEIEPPTNGDSFDDYLASEMELEEELWEFNSDFLFLESYWMDIVCDLLLDFCLDPEVTDEEIYGIFPDVWEPDYELYLFWEE
jgi:hypothetical protein